MEPGSRRSPAAAGLLPDSTPPVIVIVADPAWRRLLRNPEAVVRRAVRAAGMGAVVVLSSDNEVKRLNARHRGRNKPTNVLTFESNGHGQPGEIVLALGTVRREAHEARKRPADHLAHLVVHGSLHLRGHDHHGAGEARRMEMEEARILGRMRRPNPWKRT
jgi:probable rRNA maturation factor